MPVHQLRPVDQCGFHVQDRRKLLVVDLDRFQGILCRVLVPGDDNGNRLANVIDLIDRDTGMALVDHVGRHRPGSR